MWLVIIIYSLATYNRVRVIHVHSQVFNGRAEVMIIK